MHVLGDLVVRERRSGRPAFHVAETDRSISYRDLCTTAYKAGNVLRYLGVRERATVAVVGTVGPHPLWAFYGAGQLGAVTRFAGHEDAVDAAPRVLLLPVTDEERVAPGPRTKLATYGGAPTQVTTLHWEKELWSENPAVHPTDVDPTDPLLTTGSRTYTHEDVLDAARAVVDAFDLDETRRVAVRGPLSQPHVVTAGLVAPILAGGTVVAPTEESSSDVAVVGHGVDAVPEPRVCRADDVPL
ncbi:AMP-binding protein [Salinigranum halophilum]|uniref:AMP-binding protein n=1 Tax=Salinigranum halophilum TaxID=2565931 RepID=UPI00115CC26D|nr:AMP-binding protein [Salinigranum halophilum]